MIDTHAHLNFKRFEKNFDEVIREAKKRGVRGLVIPGTDLKTSRRAIEIAGQYPQVLAAVGLHPHHAYKLKAGGKKLSVGAVISEIEKLIVHPQVVAVGEIGLDKHAYQRTKYGDYKIDDGLMDLQKELFAGQIKLAIKYRKSLILHNREAVDEFLEVLNRHWDSRLEGKTVFHCCEPNDNLLDFGRRRKVFIGVDGDVTYDLAKQAFIKKVPLELVVLETDSPFLLPEPLRSRKKYPNKPGNLPVIVDFLARLLGKPRGEIVETTTQNAASLLRDCPCFRATGTADGI